MLRGGAEDGNAHMVGWLKSFGLYFQATRDVKVIKRKVQAAAKMVGITRSIREDTRERSKWENESSVVNL